MALVDGLITELNKRGLTVHPTDDPNTLTLRGKLENVTPELRAAVKKFKADLLLRYGRKKEDQTAGEPEPEPE